MIHMKTCPLVTRMAAGMSFREMALVAKYLPSLAQKSSASRICQHGENDMSPMGSDALTSGSSQKLSHGTQRFSGVVFFANSSLNPQKQSIQQAQAISRAQLCGVRCLNWKNYLAQLTFRAFSSSDRILCCTLLGWCHDLAIATQAQDWDSQTVIADFE